MDTDLMIFGIALAALMIGLFVWTRTAISRIGVRPDKPIDDPRRGMSEILERLDGRLRAVERGQARLEGLFEGLREAIVGRKDAA